MVFHMLTKIVEAGFNGNFCMYRINQFLDYVFVLIIHNILRNIYFSIQIRSNIINFVFI